VTNVFGFSPGVVTGLRIRTGNFVFQPELGLSGNFPVGGSSSSGNVALLGPSVGVTALSATVGLNVGGQFDLRPVTTTPAPVAPAVVEPAPTAASTPPPAPLQY
jgi:hypothetical protein